MPIIIEFAGHAGCGKTFLAKRLADELGDQCIDTDDVPLRMNDALLFVAMNPRKTMLCLRYVFSSRQGSVRYFFKSVRRVLVYFMKIYAAVRKGSAYIILSEGSLKIFNDIRRNSSSKNLTYNYLAPSVRKEIFSCPDVVVFVISSLDVAAKRLALRESPKAKEIDIENKKKTIRPNFFLSLEENRGNIIFAKKEHNFRLVEIDNTEFFQADRIEEILCEIRSMKPKVL